MSSTSSAAGEQHPGRRGAGDAEARDQDGAPASPVTAPRRRASRRRTARSRRPRPSPVTSQKRTITVFSVQPASSKWWCSGAIRNTRRRVARKKATWMTTDRVTATNSPPSTTSSSSVRVTIASPDISPPSASEPVSPMKIRAGAVFHHRKPRQAPIADGGDQRDVERVADGVAAVDGQRGAAVVAELPERDDHVGGEDHRRAAGRQAVEAVGQVHRVGEPRDEQVRERATKRKAPSASGAMSRTKEIAVVAAAVPPSSSGSEREHREGDARRPAGRPAWRSCSAPGCAGGGS